MANYNYAKSYEIKRKAAEKRAYKETYAFLNKLNNLLIQKVNQYGVEATNAQLKQFIRVQDTEALVFSITSKESLIFYEFTAKEIEKTKALPNLGIGFFSEVWKERVLRIIRESDFYSLIVGITDTTMKRVSQVFAAGMAERIGAKEMARMLRKEIGYNRVRALRIARTQVNMATRIGRQGAAESSPYLLDKVWVHGAKRDPRDNHVALNGTRIKKEELFDMGNGIKMDEPGDPRGGAGEVINCTCTVAYVVRE